MNISEFQSAVSGVEAGIQFTHKRLAGHAGVVVPKHRSVQGYVVRHDTAESTSEPVNRPRVLLPFHSRKRLKRVCSNRQAGIRKIHREIPPKAQKNTRVAGYQEISDCGLPLTKSVHGKTAKVCF